MNRPPCAKLTMRMMPKISVSPQAMKNSTAACESALRLWAKMKPTKFMRLRRSPGAAQRAAVRCRPGVQGQHAWTPDQRRTIPLRSMLRRIRGTGWSPRGLLPCGEAIRGDRLARVDFHDLRDRFRVFVGRRDLHHEALVLAL